MSDKQIRESLIDLIRECGGLDEDSWLNDDLRFFLSPKRYASVSQETIHLPNSIKSRSYTCPNGHRSAPNWLEKVPPLIPFCPKAGGTFWPDGISNYECPTCQEPVSVSVERGEYGGSYGLFGDEAERNVNGKRLILFAFTGALTGFTSQGESKLIERFYNLKKAYCPKLEPSEWVLHLKDAYNSKCRERDDTPYHENTRQTDRLVNDILSVAGEFHDKSILNTYVSYAVVSNKLSGENYENLKRAVLGSALIVAVEDAANLGLGTRFFFERTGKDGWITNYARSLLTTRFWPVLSKGNPFQAPKMVEPSFHPFLEIADVLCYAIARDFFLRQQGKASPFKVCPKGKIHYITNTTRGWTRVYSGNMPV